jgi:hypothetical protein
MNSVLAVAHSPRRIAMMFVAGLIILWFFIPGGDDFTRHHSVIIMHSGQIVTTVVPHIMADV